MRKIGQRGGRKPGKLRNPREECIFRQTEDLTALNSTETGKDGEKERSVHWAATWRPLVPVLRAGSEDYENANQTEVLQSE